MKKKILIISILLLSCLPSFAGRHSSNIGAAAIGAAAGMFLGAAIANNNNSCSSHTYYQTEYVPQYRNNYYTERVEVCRPVVETRRVYTRPATVVTHYQSRPRTEIVYNRSYAPVYQYNECYSTYY